MLLFRTTLRASPIHGIGLFAAERIVAGAVVWRFAPGFDQRLDDVALAALSDVAREQVLGYAYIDTVTGERILCGDDARFFNHSTDPNVADVPGNPYECVALRDIEVGDEIKSDYFLFDRTATEKLPAD